MPQPSTHAGALACRMRLIFSWPNRLRLAESPSRCAPRLPRLTDSSATPIVPAWMRMESRGPLETGMTASEAAPAPWEIWHARFNFDDPSYKFRTVLVLACSPGGFPAAMITGFKLNSRTNSYTLQKRVRHERNEPTALSVYRLVFSKRSQDFLYHHDM